MLRFMKPRSKKVGAVPGEAVHVGEACSWGTQIRIVDFDADACNECQPSGVADVARYKDSPTVTWIDVAGIHQVETIKKLNETFGWHALVIEDVVNSDQRPKIEEYDNYSFIVLKALSFNETSRTIKSEQISLLVGANNIVTFRESKSPLFEPVLNRIRNGKGRIRKMGSDYLAYAILDLIVDHYFAVLEKLGYAVEEVEEELIQDPNSETLRTIHSLNKEILLFRKTVWPMREITNQLNQGESELIQDPTAPFLRDLYDHTIQVIETGETFREAIANMLNLYMSQVSNRMNEVMKVLTVFAAIFIPLTFLAGIYGMNFEHMPELHTKYGYPILLVVMGAAAFGMLYFFRRKKWL